MSTLILRLAAPLQAFGDSSVYRLRYTAPDPTLSALQGLLAASAGIGRGVRLPALIADLDPVLRIERAGSTLRDFHTVNPFYPETVRGLDNVDRRTRDRLVVVRRASGTAATAPVVTERFYRQDSEHLAFLRDPDGQLESWLRAPTWGLYAGRKACPFTAPFLLGRVDADANLAAEYAPSVAAPVGEDVGVREVITFTDPGRPARTDVRQDRMSAERRHTRQMRWYRRVRIPLAESWFDIAEQFKTEQKETTC